MGPGLESCTVRVVGPGDVEIVSFHSAHLGRRPALHICCAMKSQTIGKARTPESCHRMKLLAFPQAQVSPTASSLLLQRADAGQGGAEGAALIQASTWSGKLCLQPPEGLSVTSRGNQAHLLANIWRRQRLHSGERCFLLYVISLPLGP